MSLSAITFDIWDTIIIDDSDEAKRAELGMRSKAEERRHLLWTALNRGTPIDRAKVEIAFDTQEAIYRKTWLEKQVTLKVRDRLEIMLEGLERRLPTTVLEELVDTYESMELKVSPDLVEGAGELIAEFAEHYKLCVISDTIYTPGHRLRELLAKLGVADYFSGFVFSDEIGRSKPHASCFNDARRQLGVDFSDMLHIGDRDALDMAGARAVGMRAVLFTGSRDERSSATTKAEGVAGSYRELAEIIRSLES